MSKLSQNGHKYGGKRAVRKLKQCCFKVYLLHINLIISLSYLSNYEHQTSIINDGDIAFRNF